MLLDYKIHFVNLHNLYLILFRFHHWSYSLIMHCNYNIIMLIWLFYKSHIYYLIYMCNILLFWFLLILDFFGPIIITLLLFHNLLNYNHTYHLIVSLIIIMLFMIVTSVLLFFYCLFLIFIRYHYIINIYKLLLHFFNDGYCLCKLLNEMVWYFQQIILFFLYYIISFITFLNLLYSFCFQIHWHIITLVIIIHKYKSSLNVNTLYKHYYHIFLIGLNSLLVFFYYYTIHCIIFQFFIYHSYIYCFYLLVIYTIFIYINSIYYVFHLIINNILFLYIPFDIDYLDILFIYISIIYIITGSKLIYYFYIYYSYWLFRYTFLYILFI